MGAAQPLPVLAQVLASEEAERGICGAVLQGVPGALKAARAVGVGPEHFSYQELAVLWASILRVADGGPEHAVFTRVTTDLVSRGELTRAGGLELLQGLSFEAPFDAPVAAYAAMLGEKSLRREALRWAESMRAAAMTDSPPGALQAQLERAAESLARGIERLQPLSPVAAAFRAVPVADLADSRPLAPTYAWRDWIPHGHVTVLSGHGGVGKSLIAGMLTVRIGVGGDLFGVPVQRQRVAFFSGEDGADLLRHRLLWICQGLGVDPAELDGWVHILDATEGDPTLFAEMTLDGRRVGTTTATYGALARYLDEHDIGMLVLDNMSDTFDANEIERPKVRAFMRALMQLRKDRCLTVLLLAHVDKGTARGERIGSESYSGSTALHNSARSRIFVWKDKDGALVIEHQKHNLGPLQQPLRLDWPVGGLPQAQAAPNGYVQAIAATADLKALLRLIAEFHGRGEYVATAQNSSASAPRLLAGERGYPKARKSSEVQAMLRDAERDGLLLRVKYRGQDRHERERWELTGPGQALIGQSAGSAGSAGSAVHS